MTRTRRVAPKCRVVQLRVLQATLVVSGGKVEKGLFAAGELEHRGSSHPGDFVITSPLVGEACINQSLPLARVGR